MGFSVFKIEMKSTVLYHRHNMLVLLDRDGVGRSRPPTPAPQTKIFSHQCGSSSTNGGLNPPNPPPRPTNRTLVIDYLLTNERRLFYQLVTM